MIVSPTAENVTISTQNEGQEHPKMITEEHLVEDYSGPDLTVDKHPMYYRRSKLRRQDILSADESWVRRHGALIADCGLRIAGCAIALQRPGTVEVFIFISLEDETSIANTVITLDLYDHALPYRCA